MLGACVGSVLANERVKFPDSIRIFKYLNLPIDANPESIYANKS